MQLKFDATCTFEQLFNTACKIHGNFIIIIFLYKAFLSALASCHVKSLPFSMCFYLHNNFFNYVLSDIPVIHTQILSHGNFQGAVEFSEKFDIMKA